MARILIVDDEPANRELLVAFLEGDGHELDVAESGERALAIARAHLPDLVLLDVMMPKLDGYATTRALKQIAGPEFVPVILVTALNDRASRVRGLDAGADEFLTKPLDRSELMLRVANLLALRSKTTALALRNVELLELQRFRDEMGALVVHDLKNPMTVVVLCLDYLTDNLPGLPADLAGALTDARDAGQRTIRLITNLLDLVRLEAGRLQLLRQPVDLRQLVELLVAQRAGIAAMRGIEVSAAELPKIEVSADADLITRTLENVLDNGLRYTPVGGRIEASLQLEASMVKLRIGNTGPAIPLERREQIFEKYGQAGVSGGRMNLGLGLYFCRMVAEAHGGQLHVEETPALPTVFTLALPLG